MYVWLNHLVRGGHSFNSRTNLLIQKDFMKQNSYKIRRIIQENLLLGISQVFLLIVRPAGSANFFFGLLFLTIKYLQFIYLSCFLLYLNPLHLIFHIHSLFGLLVFVIESRAFRLGSFH